MSATFLQKFNSLLTGPVSFHAVVPFLEKSPWRLAATGAVAMTGSVMATGALAVALAGKQLLFLFIPVTILAPLVGAAVAGLIAVYLKPSSELLGPKLPADSTERDLIYCEPSTPPATACMTASQELQGTNPIDFSTKGLPAAMLLLNAPPPELTVLVLERERGMREIIKEGLANAGFHPICALTAKHAAWICRNHGGLIDLLLMNVTALGQRPLDCLQTIKATQPDLPVLLISAYDRQTLCEQHPQLLATYEFLPIPLEFPHLAETIHTLFAASNHAGRSVAGERSLDLDGNPAKH